MSRHALSRTTLAALLASTALSVTSIMAAQADDNPSLVATIPPLAAIAADIMDGVGAPTLLIENGGSPHGYSLRPSDAAALADADYVLWIGENLELFLADRFETLAPAATILTAAELPGVSSKEFREPHDHSSHGGHDDHDDHGHDDHKDHHGHDHSGADPHVWLSPDNAIAIARGLANAMVADLAADHATRVKANLANFEASVLATKETIATQLAPVAEVPYLTFHDAYQYFETTFPLAYKGSVTISPEVQPGAASLRELREEIAEESIDCIFSEPQFEPRIIRVIAENLPVRTGMLDPVGDGTYNRVGGYQAFLTNLANGYAECLGS